MGIDFGTSFTVVASRRGDAPPEVIEVDGERRTPSVVLVTDSGAVVVGRAAEEMAATRPDAVVRAVKLRLGDPVPVVVRGNTYSALSLAAEVLAKVYDEALRHQGCEPVEVRLTHPATWGRARTEFLERAAQLAGLQEPTLVLEPVAAAVAYSDLAATAPGEYVAVYDLGGGTLDLAVLRRTNTAFSLVGRPGGDPQLGGELFDELLAAHLTDRLGSDVAAATESDSEPWQQAQAAIRREARRAKELLSTQLIADVLIPLPLGLRSLQIQRSELDALVAPYLEEGARQLARLVAAAGLEPGDLSAVYLAGGSSRTVGIAEAIGAELPGVVVSRRGDPKAAVALGATHAFVSSGRGRHPQDAVATKAERPAEHGLATVAVLLAGPSAGREFLLTAAEAMIGRDPGAEISVDDATMSRQHARLTLIGSRWWIEDVGSHNGTVVDGTLIDRPVPVEPESIVECGATLIRLEADGRPVSDRSRLAPAATVSLDDVPPTRWRLPAPPRRRAGDGDAESFRVKVAEAVAEIRAAARAEVAALERDVPGMVEVLRTAEWLATGGHRPGAAAPQIRLGWESRPASLDIIVEPDGDPTLTASAVATLERAALLGSAPIVVPLGPNAVIEMSGDPDVAASGARWIVAQLVVRFAPEQVRVAAGTAGDPAWDWARNLPHWWEPGTPRPAGVTTVQLAAATAPYGPPPDDGALRLHYLAQPARVTVVSAGVAGATEAMADGLSEPLARTIGDLLTVRATLGP